MCLRGLQHERGSLHVARRSRCRLRRLYADAHRAPGTNCQRARTATITSDSPGSTGVCSEPTHSPRCRRATSRMIGKVYAENDLEHHRREDDGSPPNASGRREQVEPSVRCSITADQPSACGYVSRRMGSSLPTS
jgi:hypothetical protein